MACGPPCGVAVGRMNPGRKTITSPGRFLISVDVIAWKSNPWWPLRHGANRMATTIPQKDESPSEGPKNGVQGQGAPYASAGDDDRHERIDFPDGRFRRESAEIRMRIRMHFDFGGRKRLQCLQAVELRPDSIDIRMQPYALPLKGKGRKKVQLPKEAHKVHTDA